MHAARLATSPRLRRVLAVLADGQPHTTRAIMRAAHVCAVNSCVAELRANGAEIDCTVTLTRRGRRHHYTLTKAPETQA